MIVMFGNISGAKSQAKSWTRGIEHTRGYYYPTPCSMQILKMTFERHSRDTHSPRQKILSYVFIMKIDRNELLWDVKIKHA
jgi:hypothetical protein